jgi:hypothetical protein
MNPTPPQPPATGAKQEAPLTPEQIENWRGALFNMIGPYAMIAPTEDIQKMKDNMQKRFNPPAL